MSLPTSTAKPDANHRLANAYVHIYSMDEDFSMGFMGCWTRYLPRTTVSSMRLVWVYDGNEKRIKQGQMGYPATYSVQRIHQQP